MAIGDPGQVISHWGTMIEGLECSPPDFYDIVKEQVKGKHLKDLSISSVSKSEGGLFSSSRAYLRITRQDLVYDICGAPFGNGFFVSWWLGRKSRFADRLALIPIIGPFFAKPITYYQIDTASMFQSLVHGAVMEAVDAVTKQAGVTTIPESARTPIMRDFWT